MLTSRRPEDILLQYFDHRLMEFGDTAQGAYWPNEADRKTRFDVMLDIIPTGPRSVVLCDLGCGTGELLAHIRARGLDNIIYVGVDRSQVALAHARAKFPDAQFIEMDVTAPDANLNQLACDYLVANGLFTARFELTYEEMWSFLVAMIMRVWPLVRRGLGFNVMSKVVQWERDDLFHLPMDDAGRLLHGIAGRNVVFRADYGLYEYTAYAYKQEGRSLADGANLIAKPAEDYDSVPVLRPQLPQADRLLPYLRRIDETRLYSNHGPLVLELERRLAGHLQLDAGVASANSGTSALIGAILAQVGFATKTRPLALMPAFTFVATAVAAEICGFQPYLVDIDADSLMLDVTSLNSFALLDQVGVVIPVAPFGRPVPQQAWLDFQASTRIPVVIDGAASFDRLTSSAHDFVGAIPVILSLHATKAFGVGEGGCVLSTDAALVTRVVRALNFGFETSRNSLAPSINGKMSEYHAAVGLAGLDGWARKHDVLMAVIDAYRKGLAKVGLADRFVAAPDIGESYSLFRCHDAHEAICVQNSLTRAGVGWRLWYGTGLQHQTRFMNLPRAGLTETEAVAPCLLGLPMAPDLTERHMARVIKALTDGLVDGVAG